MFGNDKIAMYLKTLKGRDDTREDGTKRRVLVLGWQLEPFTAKHANALGVKSHLFNSKGDPHAHVHRIELDITTEGPQRIRLSRAPDTKTPIAEMPTGLELHNVAVEPVINVRKEGETPSYSAKLTLVTDGLPLDVKDYLYLFQGQTAQHFLTFEVEQGDLLEREAEAAARKPALRHPKRPKVNGSTGEAPTSAPAS